MVNIANLPCAAAEEVIFTWLTFSHELINWDQFDLMQYSSDTYYILAVF